MWRGEDTAMEGEGKQTDVKERVMGKESRDGEERNWIWRGRESRQM